MKNIMKNACVIFALLFAGSQVFGQNEQKVYLGAGMGLDYGGIGGKVEYLPVKYFGIFGGLGHNLHTVGWNVGATGKLLPDKKVSPNLMVFYGYNGAFKVLGGPSDYDMTCYGVTVGANLDIKLGRKGNKLSVGLYVPFRTTEFKDNYEAAKNDPNIEMWGPLLPIMMGVGFNWKL